jgi:hypothetical protein
VRAAYTHGNLAVRGKVRAVHGAGRRAQCNYPLTEMELRHYTGLWETHLLFFSFFKFLMVLALTYINISVTVNPGSMLRQFLRDGVSGTMSSLYMTSTGHAREIIVN